MSWILYIVFLQPAQPAGQHMQTVATYKSLNACVAAANLSKKQLELSVNSSTRFMCVQQ